MEQHFDRFRRNDFWVNIHKNTDAYNISTNSKYVNLINHFFPILERNSPTKWKIRLSCNLRRQFVRRDACL